MTHPTAILRSMWLLAVPVVYSQPLVYVTSYNTSTIKAVNTANDTVIASIPTPPYPTVLAVAPGGGRLYFAANERALFVADTSVNQVVGSVPLEDTPLSIGLAPSGSRAYVLYSTFLGYWLAVLNLDTLTVLSTAPVCDGAYKMAQKPDGSRLYLMSGATNTVCIYDPSQNAVTGNITLPPNTIPSAVAISPDGSRLYVALSNTFFDPNATGGHLVVIDTATNSTVAVLDTPFGVPDLVVAPDGTRLYVADPKGALVIFDIQSNAATGSTKLRSQPDRMAISPDGRRIFVNYPFGPGPHTYFDQTAVVDTVLGREVDSVTVGGFPRDIALTNVFPPDRVFIDIAPNTLANNLNPSGNDQIAVAILSSPSFNAGMVDRSSVAFGRTGTEASALSCAASLSDVNSDGLPDLVCNFDESKTGLQSGDTTGYLTGRIISGPTIRGFDAVSVQ